MPLNPSMQGIADQMVAAGRPPLETLPPAVLRAGVEAVMTMGAPGPEMAFTEDMLIPGGEGDIPARLYRPADHVDILILFFHGGGWVTGSIAAYDATCRFLARETGCAILSVDYRLAPEHPYPAALADAQEALNWTHENLASLVGQRLPIVIMGDSAGGYLAARVAQDEIGSNRVAAQVLIYPVLDATMASDSYREFEAGPFLSGRAMAYFWGHFLPDSSKRGQADVSPLLCDDLTDAPPAVIVSVECDPLRDETETYARRLTDAGVPVRDWRVDGLAHGAFTMGGQLPEVVAMMAGIGEALRELLTSAVPAFSPSSPSTEPGLGQD